MLHVPNTPLDINNHFTQTRREIHSYFTIKHNLEERYILILQLSTPHGSPEKVLRSLISDRIKTVASLRDFAPSLNHMTFQWPFHFEREP